MVPAKRITFFSTQFPFLRKDESSYPHRAACEHALRILKHIVVFYEISYEYYVTSNS